MHPNSRMLFELYGAPLIQPGMKVLEIGPDKIPTTLQEIAGRPGIAWDLLDTYESPHVQIRATSAYDYPITEGTYDVVVAANVLEHVPHPWRWVRELARVTKPGGTVLTINPVSWPYHEAPVDCWRAYPDGMRALYEEAGLTVVLARCETHEKIRSKHDTPGRSMTEYHWKHRLIDGLLGVIGYPQERAYDTVCVGQRPAKA